MTRRLLCVLLLLLAGGQAPTLQAQEPKSPFDRWEKAVAALEKRLADRPPPKDAVFFAGSSSIVRWDVEKSFPAWPVVKVGFGGSQLADSVHFAPRLITPHRPATVVVYAGDNDIAAGKTPEQVRDDFRQFVGVVRKARPDTRIVFLSVKPSVARWKKIDTIRAANKLIEAECRAAGRGVVFVDVGSALLGEDGQPRAELFEKDGLHLAPAGYAAWAKVVLPHLK